MKTSRWIIIPGLVLAIGGVMYARSMRSTAKSDTTESPSKNLPRLVDLGAGKCIPCKAMAPILEELRSEYAGKFGVVFIDVWENPDAAEPYKINLIPTQIFFDTTGKELWRHEGFMAKADILSKWAELGLKL